MNKVKDFVSDLWKHTKGVTRIVICIVILSSVAFAIGGAMVWSMHWMWNNLGPYVGTALSIIEFIVAVALFITVINRRR